ncbi:hypothetical protein WJX81_005501 [Elliptochloris bilobata]|uniref:Uncharacterized protein n=1 Tax=Elliptochloris bilobata TaxID=381761 RepID=A0AAW1RZ60_9CHLO
MKQRVRSLRSCRGGPTHIPSALALTSAGGSSRGLATARPLAEGDVAASLPWSRALTPNTSLARLARHERHGCGLLPGGIARLEGLVAASAAREAAAATSSALRVAGSAEAPRNAAPQAGTPDAGRHEASAAASGDADLLPTGSGWVLLLALGLLAEARDARSAWAPYLRLLPAPPGSRLAAVMAAGPPATDLLLFGEDELAALQNDVLAEAVRLERQRLARLHAALFLAAWTCALLRGYAFVPVGAAHCAPYEVYEGLGSRRHTLVVEGSPQGRTFRLCGVRIGGSAEPAWEA